MKCILFYFCFCFVLFFELELNKRSQGHINRFKWQQKYILKYFSNNKKKKRSKWTEKWEKIKLTTIKINIKIVWHTQNIGTNFCNITDILFVNNYIIKSQWRRKNMKKFHLFNLHVRKSSLFFEEKESGK